MVVKKLKFYQTLLMILMMRIFFPNKFLLTNTQISKLRNAFANPIIKNYQKFSCIK